MFGQKLTFLMECLEITNVQLAVETHMDPSYVSKLRNGRRKLPSHSDFIGDVAAFFAAEVVKKEKQDVLAQVMQRPYPDDISAAEDMLRDWLKNEKDRGDLISNLLYQISHSGVADGDLPATLLSDGNREGLPYYYYGVEGKRKAVLRFFEEVLASKVPLHLKLYSEENMKWMLGDPAFAKKWSSLFAQCLRQGARVSIVHSLSRDLDELIESIISWLPVYMTGRIAPYYCPKKRDGIFQRTLFLAVDAVAIESTALAHNSDVDMLNVFVTDREAVGALEREFDCYLELCRPLMDIVTDHFRSEYGRLYDSHIVGSGSGAVYYKGATPSFITLPDDLAKEIDARYPESGFYTLYRHARDGFLKLLEKNDVHSIFNIPKLDDSPIWQGVLFTGEAIHLSREDKIRHYQEIIRLANMYANYHIYLDEDIDPQICVFMNEDHGVIVERYSIPPTLFGITEPTMTSAFYHYLDDAARIARVNDQNRSLNILERTCKVKKS